MKTIQITLGLLLAVAAAAPLRAQISAFTYQGRLNLNGVPANGYYDFRFRLLNAPTDGVAALATPIALAVTVSNGLFTTGMDFGAENFDGADRWLEINARTNGGGPFTTLSPRQLLTPTPYAITANSANNLLGALPASQISGTILNASLPASPSFSGTVTANNFSGNGASLANLNAATLGGLNSSNFWRTAGNPGTTAGTHFLGTTDNQPLELKVNNQRTLRLEPAGSNSVNVVGGWRGNIVAAGVVGATIAGGGAGNYSGFAYSNSVAANFGTIGGGAQNAINAQSSDYATIGGGYRNAVLGDYVTIGGGNGNNGAGSWVTIGGGLGNTINSGGSGNTVAGGSENTIDFLTSYATIGGGAQNAVGGFFRQYATVPGGRQNSALGNDSFAAGRRAKANHDGAFVWGDSTDADITSANTNSVTIRASGGYRLFTDTNATTGAFLAAGSGSWTSMSDRNAKENFRAADGRTVLEKVVALPVQTWNYKSQDASTRHIGPMAQDFKAAFGVGESDTGIATVDADGVALAAIQGLNQKLEETRAENAELKQRLTELERAVRKLGIENCESN